MKKIVQTGNDRLDNHREDFETCPACRKKFEDKIWDKRATTLILHPRIFKSSSVSILSECPNCFEPSWVHHKRDTFHIYDYIFPTKWIEAVEKLEASIHLEALREWGRCICHKCKHLNDGRVEHSAWRTCIKGIGPAVKECDKFEGIK